MTRPDGRAADALRRVRFTRGWLEHAEGSVLVEFGRTRVLCAASVAEEVPRWRRGSGQGWVTAEYAMLPPAPPPRGARESARGRLGGRTQEISRLVGRSLRACVDYKALGENTIVIDCDVLQADGGTRTAAVTGGYVALADAVAWLKKRKRTKGDPLLTSVSAVSVGIVGGGARACPVLRGGRGRADRHERGLHRQRRLRGDPGHGRAGTVQPRSARPAARPRCRGLRRADQAARCRAGVIAGPSVVAAQPDVTAVAADTVVLATRNAAKLRELARILGAEDSASRDGGEQIRLAGLDEFPPAPDVPETGATFEENALLKARAIADYTGLPAVADDSGLCVDALNGMPGVLSARWAGRHGDDKANLELVLAQVTDVPDTRLGAQFVCAAALVVPAGAGWGVR